MTGKARSNSESFEAFQLEQNAKFENFMNQNSNINGSQFFITPPPKPTNPLAFLSKQYGGIIAASIGYNASVTQIISGAIDIGRDSGKLSSHIIIQAETGIADVLDSINNFIFQYQDITIQADTTDTITVSTSGNIFLGDSVSSVILNPNEQLRLRYDIITNKWTAFKDTTSGGGGVSFPIRPPVTTGLPTTGNITLDLNATSGHYFTIGPITGDIDIDIINPPAVNIAQAFRINITQDGTGGHTVTFNDSLLVAPLINLDIDGVTLLAGDIYDGAIFNIFTMTSTAGSGGSGSIDQWATFPAVTNINYNTFDGINIDRLLFDQAAGSSLVSTSTGITSDAASGLNFNVPSGSQYNLFFAAASSYIITATSFASQTIVPVGTDDVGSSILPWNAGFIDNITVGGAGDGIVAIGHLDFVDNLATPAAALSLYTDGTDILANTGAGVKNLSDIGAGSPLTTKGDIFGFSTVNARIPVGSNNQVLTADSVEALGVKWATPVALEFFGPWTATHDAGSQLLDNIGQINSDAANIPSSGKIRLGNNELLSWLKIDNVSLVTFGLGNNDNLNVLGTDLDLQSNDVISVTKLGGVLASALTIDVPTVAQLLNLSFGGVTEWQFTDTSLTGDNIILNNTLSINDSSTFPASLGQISRNGSALGIKFDEVSIRRDTTVAADEPVLSLTRVDASPNANDSIGQIDFNIFDSPTETTYARISTAVTNVLNSANLSIDVFADGGLLSAWAILGDDSTQNFTILAGGLEPRIQPTNGPMAYFVTSQIIDFSLNVGNSGTLEFPRINDGSPSLNDLNAAGGAFNTSLVVHDISDGTLYVKNSNTQWDAYARTGTVT